MPKRFLLIDDHSIVRSGLKLIIQQEYLTALIDECSDGAAAIHKLHDAVYDLVIVDLNMPQTNAPALIQEMYRVQPSLKVLVFTMLPDAIFASRYFQLGVRGFLSKDCDEAEISLAIAAILNKKKYLSERLSNKMIEENFSVNFQNPMDSLSSREREIVKLLVTGQPHKDICKVLNIKNSTVGTYKHRIFQKLRVSNVMELKDLAALYL